MADFKLCGFGLLGGLVGRAAESVGYRTAYKSARLMLAVAAKFSSNLLKSTKPK